MAASRRRRAKTVRSEAYGKGSVYQDGNGIWWFQPPPKDGKRIKRERYATEAAAELAQAHHLADRKKKVDQTELPTVEFWFRFWFREHVKPGLKPKTIEWYEFIIDTYIIPAIGHMILKEVTGDHLIALQNMLREHLAIRTVARVHAMLNRAFKKALVSRKIDYNPVDAVEAPRVPRAKKGAFTMQEIAKIRGALEGDRLELLYDLMYLDGLRRGEALGLLLMECLEGAITVSGQIQTIDGNTSRSGSPKSDNSIRTLPLTERQRNLLRTHLERISEERRSKGWQEHGLLFPSTNGTPILPRNLNRHWYNVLIRAGIIASVEPAPSPSGKSGPKPTKRVATGKKIPLHQLRHTAASRLNSIKATPRVIQGILGHGPGTVSEGYIHPEQWEMLEALELSEQFMLRKAA
jgi:integrase